MKAARLGGVLVLVLVIGTADGSLAGPADGEIAASRREDPEPDPGSAAKPAATPADAIVSTGEVRPELASFDAMMVAVLRENGVPGGSLAVVRNGRLVLARGYGWADHGRTVPVKPDSLFRIASLSKPVTAVAVLQLVEQGKISLESRVADLLDIRPHLEDRKEPDPRLREITIRRLLQHSAGFDRGVSFDPMFRSVPIARALGVDPPAASEHIIRYMWGRSLDFDPGARFAYSNFGFCLLGRVIEKVTGQGYERYVRAAVLAPVGIHRMRIGRTLAGGRADDEVEYFDPHTGPAVLGKIGEDVPLAYGGWYLEAMDAHGGWIASAVDMARFVSRFQDGGGGLLRPQSVRTMFARPAGRPGLDDDGKPRDAYYACGWAVRRVENGGFNYFHTGSLSGTAALLVGRHDGVGWAVLFNQRSGGTGPDRVKHLGRHVDPLVHRAADAVETWPAIDLFSRYGIRDRRPGERGPMTDERQ